MSEHKAWINWQRRAEDDFLKGKYSREHTWKFDGGLVVPASPALSNVPLPWSNPANIDPEEAYVASISSCHMLTYLWLAFKAGYVVETYEDEAVGTMARNEKGALWVNEVVLNLHVTYAPEHTPSREAEDHLHHESHEQCFIANSIRTNVRVERNM
jgi:organic hydroperoxide reductase OsmC/OhrA